MKPDTEQKYFIEKDKEGGLINNRPYKEFAEALRTLPAGRYIIGLKKYRKQRTLKENAFYWGNFIQSEIECFEEYWGETYTKELIHEFNKVNIWGEEKVIEETGEIIKMPESSTDQTTVEWEIKLEKARQRFRQNFNWELPYPLEQTDLDFDR